MSARDERVETAAKALSPHLWDGRHEAALAKMPKLFTPKQAAEAAETKRSERVEEVGIIVAASDAVLRDGIERALFKIEGIHHIHGIKCLCGFESHRSRSRTEHITAEIRAAIAALLDGEA